MATWARRWFGARPVAVTSFVTLAGPPPPDIDGDWRRHADLVAVKHSRVANSRLLERALDLSLEGLVLSEIDRRVIAALAQRVIEDLAATLKAALDVGTAALPDPLGPFGCALIGIAEGRDQLLTVAIPLEALVRLRKAELAPASRSANPLAGVSEALQPTTVVLEASLGKVKLSLAELQGLSPGDIVVLDRVIEDGGEISLIESDVVFARATLSGSPNGHLALTVQAHSN